MKNVHQRYKKLKFKLTAELLNKITRFSPMDYAAVGISKLYVLRNMYHNGVAFKSYDFTEYKLSN